MSLGYSYLTREGGRTPKSYFCKNNTVIHYAQFFSVFSVSPKKIPIVVVHDVRPSVCLSDRRSFVEIIFFRGNSMGRLIPKSV